MAYLQADARALAHMARRGDWMDFLTGLVSLCEEHGHDAACLAVEVAIARDRESRAMHEKGWWE